MNIVGTIWEGMVTGFGTTWIAALFLFFGLIILSLILFQSFWMGFIFSSMVIVIFMMSGLFSNIAVGYIAIGISLIFAIIIARLLIR